MRAISVLYKVAYFVSNRAGESQFRIDGFYRSYDGIVGEGGVFHERGSAIGISGDIDSDSHGAS